VHSCPVNQLRQQVGAKEMYHFSSCRYARFSVIEVKRECRHSNELCPEPLHWSHGCRFCAPIVYKIQWLFTVPSFYGPPGRTNYCNEGIYFETRGLRVGTTFCLFFGRLTGRGPSLVLPAQNKNAPSNPFRDSPHHWRSPWDLLMAPKSLPRFYDGSAFATSFRIWSKWNL